MNNGLILGKDLKMTNLVNLTEEKVKDLKAEGLTEVLEKMNDMEKDLLAKAIRDSFNEAVPQRLRDERIAESLKIAVYRVMQDIAQGEK